MNFAEYKAKKKQMDENVLKILADDTKENTIYTLHKCDRESGFNLDYGVFRQYSHLKTIMDECVEFEEHGDSEELCAADYMWFNVEKYTMTDDEYVKEMDAILSFNYRLVHYIADECVLKYHRTNIEHELEPPYETGDIIKVKNMPIAEDYYGIYIYDEKQTENKHMIIHFNENPGCCQCYWLETTEKATESPDARISEISKKIKKMNGDYTSVLQNLGIKVEVTP